MAWWRMVRRRTGGFSECQHERGSFEVNLVVLNRVGCCVDGETRK